MPKLAAGDTSMRAAWLYLDEGKPAFEATAQLLIADVERRRKLVAPSAIFKAAAVLACARGGVELSETKHCLECTADAKSFR